MKKKHRIVVEVSFDAPIAEKHAAQLIHAIVVDNMGPDQAIYETDVRHGATAIKVAVKCGSKVFGAMLREDRKSMLGEREGV